MKLNISNTRVQSHKEQSAEKKTTHQFFGLVALASLLFLSFSIGENANELSENLELGILKGVEYFPLAFLGSFCVFWLSVTMWLLSAKGREDKDPLHLPTFITIVLAFCAGLICVALLPSDNDLIESRTAILEETYNNVRPVEDDNGKFLTSEFTVEKDDKHYILYLEVEGKDLMITETEEFEPKSESVKIN